MTKRRRRTSTQTFIIILACFDLFLCVFAFIAVIGLSITDEIFSLKSCRGVYSICIVSVMQSLLVMTAIAADRYSTVCYPHRKRLTTRSTCLVAGVCLAISTMFATTIGINVRAVQASYGDLVHRCYMAPDSWGISFKKGMIGLAALCIVAVILLYLMVYWKLRKHRRVQAGLGSNLVQGDSTRTKQCLSVPQSRMKSQDVGVGETERTVLDQREKPSCAGKVATVSSTVHGKCQDKRVILEASFIEQRESSQLPTTMPKMKQNLIYNEGNINDRNQLSDSIARQLVKSPEANNAVPSFKLDKRHKGNGLEGIRVGSISRSERQATNMMLVVTIILVVSWCPSIVSFATSNQDLVHVAKSKPALYVVIYLLKFTVFISNAINPFVYTFMNKRFREESWQELRRCCCLLRWQRT
ncbi:uncharacterized protein LOC105437029 [Strongylocentrotus purpuratus]|uniref:G-protein coupled receptors family 1 profile domain-containing protein n=1 Tax=Strongylocentrotus purpuratus TaxID=7668 RepID=A0A7M7HEH7_STRPU|nr:uncharacterized protein LOC105437029 [Strongylocentrotus purpuratus]